MSIEDVYTDEDREPGFLTRTDRKFIEQGGEWSTRQGAYQRRKAIRNRITSSFLDFAMLVDMCDEELLEDILSIEPDVLNAENEDEAVNRINAVADSWDKTLTFIYDYVERGPNMNLSFETLVERAVTESFKQHSKDSDELLTEATVEIDEPEVVDWEMVAKNLRVGGIYALSRNELIRLIGVMKREGEVPPEVAEHIKIDEEWNIYDKAGDILTEELSDSDGVGLYDSSN